MSSLITNLQTNLTNFDEVIPHKRILIVDDDDIVRGLHEAVLSRAGYGTHGAVDGEEALVMLATDEFDLVLTDCRMPRLGGFGLTRALRAAGSRIPIVMVSGSFNQDRLPKDIECEVFAALPKPARTSDVLAAIAGALRHPVVAGEASVTGTDPSRMQATIATKHQTLNTL
jgi:DNA-binding NtrC family response regulator